MAKPVVFGPPTNVHPDRIGGKKNVANILIVLHTTEGHEGETSAEALAQACTAKGDRVSDSGKVFGSSYHYVLDTDRVIPLVAEDLRSFSAPPANNNGIHIVFPGKARQSRDDWLDAISSAYIDQCVLLVHDITRRTGIPLVKRTVAEVVNGFSGYIDHKTVSDAFHQTDHTDVGPNFPWDLFAERIAAADDGPTRFVRKQGQERDMRTSILELSDSPATFIGAADDEGHFFSVYWIDGDNPHELELLRLQRAATTNDGQPLVPVFRFESRVTKSLLYQNTKLPSGGHGTRADGREWRPDDFGATPYLQEGVPGGRL